MNLKSSDLTITAVNLTSLLKRAYEAERRGVEDDYELFNPSVVYDAKRGVYVAAARVFVSPAGLTNRRSWEGKNQTLICRMDTGLKELRRGSKLLSSLLGCEDSFYRSSAISRNGGCVGTEDVRLQLNGDRLYAVGNEAMRGERKVVMAELNPETFRVKKAGIICEDVQKAFEKNWAVFEADGRWHILYKLTPLETISCNNPFEGTSKLKTHPSTILDEISHTFQKVTGYRAEIRNRTAPVLIRRDTYLAMGGLVLDWNSTDPTINNLLVPGIASGESEYSAFDASYWSDRYHKLYLCFFFVLKKVGSGFEIDCLSSFFQLPTKESKDELVVFPTTLDLQGNKVLISYGVGDNRCYLASIPFPLVELMLQDSKNAQLFQGLNVNPDEPIHVARVARRVLKLDDRPSQYLLRDASS